jgi:DNA gyrase subunit B
VELTPPRGPWLHDIGSVQLRPGMYVGGTDETGLHNMIDAPLDNAVAEVRGGAATQVRLELLPGGACQISDDGAGVPIVSPGDDWETPFPLLILTRLYPATPDATRRIRPSTVSTVGLVPVNALSEWLELRTWRQAVHYVIRFEAGELTRPLERLRGEPSPLGFPRGTQITFKPSPFVFAPADFDWLRVAAKVALFRSLSGVDVVAVDRR